MDAVMELEIATRQKKDDILKNLDTLHHQANSFFRHQDVCKDHAFDVWKEAN